MKACYEFITLANVRKVIQFCILCMTKEAPAASGKL